MKQKLLAHVIYCLMMSATMTGCVSAIVTAVNLDFSGVFVEPWLYSWSIAFPVGFVLLLFVSPCFKRIVEAFIR
ncbi:DUF2798 domain-containing protein [uncultured Nitrosomonas sp.]|uniref:DUF2798 domain-containing protein n=1 Tax=uncultured Nitrosomonas sp. TaxID=156424 RepID=UPI0025E96CE3|nr:DUF2798 domain-containing protein [uncultured Nitrosomonas sp.]